MKINDVQSCDITLVKDGKTDWAVYIPNNANPQIKFASSEFITIFKEITGVELPLCYENGIQTKHKIKIGYGLSIEELGADGFIIEADAQNVVITGGHHRGVIYGVYTFFEDYADCRWFTSDYALIPKKTEFILSVISRKEKPCFEYREAYYKDAFDWRFAVRNKLNGASCLIPEEKGGHIEYAVAFVHSFNTLIPRDKYFEAHPEYFPEINGKRVTGNHHQLCLSNPDVLAITIDKVKEAFRANPQAMIASISQDDTDDDEGFECQCPKCSAIDAEEGSPSGSLLRFVNVVAEAIEEEFPDKYIDTLAYRYTRKAPKITKPRKNVLIRLCSIECCFSHSFITCDQKINGKLRNASFMEDVMQWAKISPKLFIWDYIVNFKHYLAPYPNLYALQDNMRFFRDNKVCGVFSQGCNDTLHSEFSELRAYVISKLLWNPDYDVNLAVSEFMTTYFGSASPPVLEYLKMLNDRAQIENFHISLFDDLDKDFLTPEFLEEADILFDKAEELAKMSTDISPDIIKETPCEISGDIPIEASSENNEILKRVKRYRMGVRYAKLVLSDDSKDDKRVATDIFFNDMKELGITSLCESFLFCSGDKDKNQIHAEEYFGI